MLTAKSLAHSAIGCVLLSLQVTADYSVKFSLDVVMPQIKWDGWGTSLSWWANVFGDREDIADALFALDKSVTLDGAKSAIPGLGFNIARYNIGGSSNNVIKDNGTEVAMKMSENMPAFKFMESFWVDGRSEDSTSTSWNWDADAKQRAMLKFASKRGANVFEAFVNSPPWWMNNNHATAGGEKGDADNLQRSKHDKFVLYLATVVSKAKTEWGIDFSYVAPFNEPSEPWTFPANEEGCHFSRDSQSSILALLRNKFNDLNYYDVRNAASDENSPLMTLTSLSEMKAQNSVTNFVEKANIHGYKGVDAYRGPDRRKVRDFTRALKMPLWDSKYSDEDATGLTMAESICLDINEMGVSAFVYWQALDSAGWGLIQSNPGDKWIGTPNPKYYVLAQYTRHIRSGMLIYETSDTTKTVVAYDKDKEVLVIVTVNMGDAQTVTYDLTTAENVTGPIKAWTTETSGTEALYKPSIVELSGKFFSAAFPANSVVTFEIAGVRTLYNLKRKSAFGS